MLESLSVENLALIEKAEIRFGPGLNILTGETGAGKSVVMGSVSLALGARADRDMIRAGAESALIELTFTATEDVAALLEELDLPLEDGKVVLSRRIQPQRSVSRVNGETVNAKTLRELAGHLIDIHGQRDSQELLQSRRHLEILDDFAGAKVAERKGELREAWRQAAALNRENEQNAMSEGSRQRELALLSFECGEIENAALQEGEDERLEKDYRRMANARQIGETLTRVHRQVGYDDPSGAGESIGRALRDLAGVTPFDERLEGFYSQLSDVDGILNDFNRDLSDYLMDLEFDPATFAKVENRLNEINRLKGKYGGTVGEILQAGQEKRREMERLQRQEEWMAEKRAALLQANRRVDGLAEGLSALRAQAAQRFCAEMQDALQEMNFLHVEFAVDLQRKEQCGLDGVDEAVFLISTDPGEPKKPLSLIASGGELSRIMLAVKTVTAMRGQPQTLLFDEIDAGVSGRTAWKISQKLGTLALRHQVICITHLPQIAAMADAHFYIEKTLQEGSTHTILRRLQGDGILRELARLSGAAQMTPNALETGREIMEQARQNRRKIRKEWEERMERDGEMM